MRNRKQRHIGLNIKSYAISTIITLIVDQGKPLFMESVQGDGRACVCHSVQPLSRMPIGSCTTYMDINDLDSDRSVTGSNFFACNMLLYAH